MTHPSFDKKSCGEEICKIIIEHFFPSHQFNKSYPPWLYSEEDPNIQLELDLYCPELSIALEYQGWMHSIYSSRIHKNKQRFIKQKRRDEYKKKICRDNGVLLIQVPYQLNYKHPLNIKCFLQNQLTKMGVFLENTGEFPILDIEEGTDQEQPFHNLDTTIYFPEYYSLPSFFGDNDKVNKLFHDVERLRKKLGRMEREKQVLENRVNHLNKIVDNDHQNILKLTSSLIELQQENVSLKKEITLLQKIKS